MALDEENNLLLSDDEGENWKTLQGDVKEFIFAKYSDNAFFANKNRVFAILQEVDNKNKISKNLYYSDDFFKNKSKILDDVEFFKITKCCIYAKQKNGEM